MVRTTTYSHINFSGYRTHILCSRKGLLFGANRIRTIGSLWLWIVMVSTVVSCFAVDIRLGGFKICGWLWVVIFLLELLFLLFVKSRPTFPLKWFIPWVIILAFRTNWLDLVAVQKTLLLTAPLLTGFFSSAIVRTESDFIATFRPTLILCTLYAGLTASFFTNYVMNGRVAAMTVSIVAFMYVGGMLARLNCIFKDTVPETLFARQKARSGESFDTILSLAGFLLCITWLVLVGARIALLATIAPLPFLGRTIRGRFKSLLMVAGFAALLFYLPLVQERFFFEGQGTVGDIVNGRFNSQGRFQAWGLFWGEIQKKPLLGHGSGTSAEYGMQYIGERWEHPHNEYIRMLYDLGILGLLTWLFGFIMLLLGLLQSKRVTYQAWYIAVAGLLAFGIYALTDNVAMYASFYGNLLFAIIGGYFGIVGASSLNKTKT